MAAVKLLQFSGLENPVNSMKRQKDMTILDSILKSRDITLLTKVCLVKAMVFPVVIVAQLVKNRPVMQETWVQSLGWEDPLEKG